MDTFQQQFPLSPKKFYKKMLGHVVPSAVFGLATGLVSGLLMTLIAGESQNFGVTFIITAIVAFIVANLVYLGIFAWYFKTYIARYYYASDEHLITIKKGVFMPSEIHIQYQKIQDVYVDQDIMDRILGLYDVHIASATVSSGIEAHIDGVDQATAEGLKKFILDKLISSSNSSHTQTTPMSGTVSAPVVNFSDKISSMEYPLTSKWFMSEVLSIIISSGITGFIMSCYIVFALTKKSNVEGLEIAVWIALCTLVVSLIMFGLRVIALILWKRNYVFEFRQDNLYYKAGALSLSEKHMPYASIQDITVSQGMIDRLFGLGTVTIENAAQQTVMTKNGAVGVPTGINLVGFSITDANKIMNTLRTSILNKGSQRFGL